MGLLVALVGGMNGAQGHVLDPKNPYASFDFSEEDIRGIFCRRSEKNPAYYKEKEVQDHLDYYIMSFGNNTKRLEEEIAQHKSQKSILSLNKNNQAGIELLKGLAFTGLAVASVVYLGKSDRRSSGDGAGLGLALFISTGLAGCSFYEAFNYEEIRAQRLEREKPVLAILQAEKAAQQGNNLNSIITKDAADKIPE